MTTLEPWVQASIVLVSSFVASSGFWAFVQKRDSAKSATTRLMMGLAYEKIAQVGLIYIDRGWITKDEYEDFRKYLYEPYTDLGGNGVAERIMAEVSNLPLKSASRYSPIVQVKTNKEFDNNASAE